MDQKSPKFDQKSPGLDQNSPSVDGNSSDGHVLLPPPQVPIQEPTPGKTSDRICQIPLLMNSIIIYCCEFHRVIWLFISQLLTINQFWSQLLVQLQKSPLVTKSAV